ncbi:MAG: desulfoferrodoxin [Bacteroidales bacterium]|nr:desulfoferrodoxin [Bacteroidales bacterium]
MNIKFYHCRICGNVIIKLVDSGVVPECCNREMEVLPIRNEEIGLERHLPITSIVDECTMKVEVGEQPHPMTNEHSICWICLETTIGFQFVTLSPNSKPCAMFCICRCTPVAVYEYCNLHGLWKTEISGIENNNDCKCN